MRRSESLSALGALSLLCAGCVSYPFDASAVQPAQTERISAYNRCSARNNAGEFPTANIMIECYLNADMDFARAIQLRDMAVYNNYAHNMRLVAASADRRIYNATEARQHYDQLISGFAHALTEEYRRAAADNSTAEELSAAFLMGASQSYATQPKPVFCSSTVAGKVVNTICN